MGDAVKFLSLSLFVLISFSTIHSQTVKIDFSTDLYSHSPLGKLKSATMRLWSILDHASSRVFFDAVAALEHDLFLRQLLGLNSLLDTTINYLEQDVDYDRGHYAHSLEDLRHILDIFKLIAARYTTFYGNHTSIKERAFILYLLDFITEKTDTFITVEEE